MQVEIKSLLESEAGKGWQKIGVRQHHGVNVPLFSLHSNKSSGIGEFPDLLPLFSWCKSVGFDIVQLLPLNDTGHDQSPYNAISANALNPFHLGLSSLPYLDQHPELKSQLSELHKFNLTNSIDYKNLYTKREEFLLKYFDVVFPLVQKTQDYQTFCLQNAWLEGFALFKSIKISRNWESWENWPEELKNPTSTSYPRLLKKYEKQIAFHCFVQFFCFTQFQAIKKEANQQGIFLMGDIPILINYESADVWLNRVLFITNLTAGAPPDMYSEEGQNWGFPIYNWDELKKQNYHWWKERLNVASRLYDLYRIDHVVGFFRIWAIPLNYKGSKGRFIPEDKAKWIPQGKAIMEMMLEDSSMLPIGEDLGVVPPEVRICLLGLGICGTRVMRWERMWEQDKRFIKPEDYQPASLTTVSTHDSETLTLWWQNNPEEAKEYARFKGWIYEDFLSKDHLFEILRESHHTASLFHINLLQEYLALVPGLTSSNPEEERINLPGIISDKNWSYRFHPSVEELVSNKELSDIIYKLIH